MSVSKELKASLKLASLDVQNYVIELQAENSRLAKQLAKLEAQLTTAHSVAEAAKRGETVRPTSHLNDDELMQIAKGGQ